jgi:hypothetical protein
LRARAGFADRGRAAEELKAVDDGVQPVLRKALADDLTPEARRGVEANLEEIENSPEWLRTRRAAQALDYPGTSEARWLLERLAGGAPRARLTAEADAAGRRLR